MLQPVFSDLDFLNWTWGRETSPGLFLTALGNNPKSNLHSFTRINVSPSHLLPPIPTPTMTTLFAQKEKASVWRAICISGRFCRMLTFDYMIHFTVRAITEIIRTSNRLRCHECRMEIKRFDSWQTLMHQCLLVFKGLEGSREQKSNFRRNWCGENIKYSVTTPAILVPFQPVNSCSPARFLHAACCTRGNAQDYGILRKII